MSESAVGNALRGVPGSANRRSTPPHGTAQRPFTTESVHRTRPAMGTLFEVLLRGDDEEHLAAVADAILDEVERIERLLSRFDPRSEISRINRLAGKEDVLVDQEVAALLARCFESWQWTKGAFDIAAGSRRGLPEFTDRTAVLGDSPFQAIEVPGIAFNQVRRLVRFTEPEVEIDLGGVGKGYALDRATELLDEHYVEHALLHGGTSSVLARGHDQDGEAWRIHLRHPVTGEDAGVVRLKNEALSCSAVNDQADIINPATGVPVTGEAGVAVICPSATEAEVLSTALICMGRAKAELFLLLHCGTRATAVWL